MAEFIDDSGTKARLKVVGIGGGGGNAINRMISSNLEGVTFLVANTDVQALKENSAAFKYQLGAKLTKGLGAGSDPEIGKKAALEDEELIAEYLLREKNIYIPADKFGIWIVPPLIVKKQEIDFIVDSIDEALKIADDEATE